MSAGTPTPIVVTHQEGPRFAARIRAHEIILDQPEHAGGGDMGPSPLELLGASLGSCAALYVQRFLATRGLSSAALRVEVTQHSSTNPHRIAQFDVRIILSDEIPMVYRPMLEAAARVCPAHATMAHGAAVKFTLDFPVLVG